MFSLFSTSVKEAHLEKKNIFLKVKISGKIKMKFVRKPLMDQNQNLTSKYLKFRFEDFQDWFSCKKDRKKVKMGEEESRAISLGAHHRGESKQNLI